MTTGKGIMIETSYSDARSLVTFSLGSCCYDSEGVFILAYDKKEKEHQKHPTIWFLLVSLFDALSFT
jgi:hypothetical protein